MTGGFWIGQTIKKDQSKIYILTTHGELYELNTNTDKFSHLGHFLPKNNYISGERINYIYGLTLDYQEEKLYAIPSRTNNNTSGNLYRFNLETGEVSFVTKLGPGIYTGSDIRDSGGNIYFARFGDSIMWEDNCALVKINVNDLN